MKPITTNGVKISRKSRPIRSNRQVTNWHKDVEALLISVQAAWAAAERMRLAVEKHDHDPETGEADEHR
jgi:hypothetical protein